MELLELNLTRFAGFDQLRLDLGAGGPGLYVIYGLNEAGKSTLRRALLKLLFGFDARQDPDVRGGKRRDTEVAARIRIGQEVISVRRSAHGNRLTGDKEDPEQLLAQGLRGLSRQAFEQIFCLGHRELREGGQKILSLHDDQASLLFLASGVRNADAARREIEERIKSLYTKRSRGKELDRLLKELEEAQRRLRDLQVRAEDWKKIQTELEEKQRVLDNCRTQIRQIQQRIRALDALAQRRSLERNIAERQRELAELRGAERLEQTIFERFRQAQARLDKAERDVENISVELATRRTNLDRLKAKLAGDPELAQFGSLAPEVVNKVDSRLHELQNLEEERRAAVSRLRRSLRSIRERVAQLTGKGLGSPPAALATARRIAQQLPETQLDALRRRWDRVAGQHAEAQAEGEKIARDLEQVENLCRTLQDLPSIQAIRRARLLLSRAQGRFADMRAAAEQMQERAHKIARMKAMLALDAVDDELLLAAPLPEESKLRRLSDRHRELNEAVRDAAQRVQELRDELQDLQAHQEVDEAEGLPRLEADLEQTRQRRNELWTTLRRWIVAAPQELAQLPPDRRAELVSEYENATHTVDRLSDELLRHAQQLEQFRRRQRDIRVRQGKLDQKEAERRQLEEQIAECERELKASWGELYVGQSPDRALDWLERFRELRGYLQERNRSKALLEEQERQLRAELEELLSTLRQKVELGQDWGAVLEQIPEILASMEEAAAKRDEYMRERTRLRQALEANEERLRKLAHEQSDIAATLGAAIGLSVAPKQVEAVLDQTKQLVTQLAAIDEDIERLREYRRRYKLLQTAATDATGRCELPLAGSRLIEYAQRLHRRYNEARHLLAQIADEEEKLHAREARLKDAQQELAQAEREHDEVLEELGCQTPAEVWDLHKRATRAKALLDEIRRAREQLETVPEVDAGQFPELEGEYSDAAIARLRSELEETLQQLDSRREELVRAQEQCRRELQELEKRHDQAVAAARQQEELAAAARLRLRHYFVLKAAQLVVQRAIEIHQHRAGPELEQRAGELSRLLTGGRYEGFRIDPSDRTDITIIRADGDQLGTDELSDGTADQLFLALRLAAIERFIRTEGPVPIVLDDVLVHFDDERAYYGLEALANVGNQTQVLLFTHHSRIVDLAGRINGTVVAHTLGAVPELEPEDSRAR